MPKQHHWHNSSNASSNEKSLDESGVDSCSREKNEDCRVQELSESYLSELAEGVRSHFGNGPPDPEDVAQEAFRRLLETDTSKIRNLRAYLWRTARNLFFDANKAAKVPLKYEFEVETLFFSPQGDNLSPETVVSAREQLKLINHVLRQMPEKRRRAIVLYRVEGLKMVEIARRLRISHSAVHKHLVKAHAELNAFFTEHNNDE
ncbi:MAG: sigma-70 family RNA polymerase sigma factor [Pseudomonadota bacterium]